MEENGKLVSFIFRRNEIVAEESQEDKIRYIRTNTLIASDAESARTYYHYASDEMSSITHVVDSETEEILNRYEYDAWGNLTTCEEKVSNRFKFNGQQYDSVTQQYYLRVRYYNPVIGRFTQEDTYRGDGLNLYVYCANNPVCYVDPSGHFCQGTALRLKKLIDEGGLKGKSRSRVEEILRKKIKDGTIQPWEQNIADKLGVSDNLTGGIGGYQTKGSISQSLLLCKNFNKKHTINLTEWRRKISKSNIQVERIKFLGEHFVKIENGKWRSLDGTRQFRIVKDDYSGNHAIGNKKVKIPHVHFEFLGMPNPGGTNLKLIKNIHVPLN